MARVLNLNSLGSRITRNRITQNSPTPGLRVIRDGRSNNRSITERVGDFLGRFIGGTIRFGGWIIKVILPGIAFTFQAIWGLIVEATSAIYNFDWNITDRTIDQQFEQAKIMIAGQLGETAGNAFGYLACGVIPSASILVFNEPLALYLLKKVGEEALDELAGNLQALITISFRLLLRSFFLDSYKNIRKAIKSYIRTRSTREKSAINSFFNGKITDAIDNWGEENSKPWSFSLEVQERIESIDNDLLQEFVEEFYDESKDACIEAGYVIAEGLDEWVLQQSQAEAYREGNEELIELLPDRNAPEETILISANTRQARQEITNTLNTFQLLDNRDVGQIIGEPLNESVRQPPKELALRIQFRSVQSPPWIDRQGQTAKRVQITIPSIDKAKLDWARIKAAIGGDNGYIWGRFFINGRLSNGNKINFYAATEQEGKDLLKQILFLTTAELATLNITEEEQEGARVLYPSMYKRPTRVYPAMLTVINQKKILRINEGVATSRGIYKRRRYLLPLYTSEKPEEFDLIMAELSRERQ